MVTPTNQPELDELDLARSELREGIESSREIVRQSRFLIELSGSNGASAPDNDDSVVAD